MIQTEVKCPEYGIVITEEKAGSGRYYADFLPEYDKPELVVPDEVNGRRIVGIKCQTLPNPAVRKIRLSWAVGYVEFGLQRFGGRYLELEIDDDNPCLMTDGKALYSKKGELIIFYAVGCRSYEVLPGTRVIKDGAFWESPNLRHIKLPRGVEEIRMRAFFKLTALRDINIPDTVRFLGKKAFFGCKRLEALHIPRSVQSIGECAFPISGALCKITLDPDNPHYSDENGVLYSKDKTRLVFVPPALVGKRFVVPDFVNTIGAGAFCDCSDLEEVILPPGVSVIEKRAFYGCFCLRSINLENVKRIEDRAFEQCSSLPSLVLPCDELGLKAFWNCYQMRTVTLNGLKKSGTDPFTPDLYELILYDDADFSVISLMFCECYPTFITVRRRETGEIFYKLFVSSYNGPGISQYFSEKGFDFERYDSSVEGSFDYNDTYFYQSMATIAFLRLKYPLGLSEHARGFYLSYLIDNAEEIVCETTEYNKPELLPMFFDIGMITEHNAAELIAVSTRLHNPEFTAYFLELKNRYFPNPTDKFDLE